MADEYVLRAQRFVNQTYGGRIGVTVEENGKTGWSTMYALTRALQWELGISPVADSFGPTTLRTLTQKFPRLNADTVPSPDFCRIIQAAMYCKGYNGGDLDGSYNATVQSGITRLKQDMGVDGVYPGSDLTPKVFKGLLNMDPYVVVRYGDRPGDEDVRAIQRWLNGRYIHRQDFFVMPCDGHHSRDVAKSMLFAIQYELGMADGVANGSFGPATQAGLKQHTLTVGSTGTWVNLFSAAMILNQRPHVAFSSTFTADLSSAVFEFQDFVGLSVNGDGDYRTWASLLISYGDQSRSGAACDCITTITAARAQALKSAGYFYVGRYLCNVPGGRNKMIQPGELATIASNGMNCFPIYQTSSDGAGYFNYNQGTRDGLDAIDWAKYHGFKDGTRIYFAVDYDAYDHEVTSNILPHFRGISRAVQENSRYRVGIYGPRNVCRRVREAGYTDASFVSDMSSGFSGNLGFPMPGDWAFDQIATVSVGSGAGAIEIDKNIASGRDIGQSSFDPGADTAGLDVDLDPAYRQQLLEDVRYYLTSIGVPETGGAEWNDRDWATLGGISTTKAVELVLSADWLFTSLARQLRLRKALIQAPVLWELRKMNPGDFAADTAVKTGVWDDCSTGWGQIFGWVAIEARNYCVRQGIINGQILDRGRDLDAVWTQLNEDPIYNIKSVAYLTIYNAFQVDKPRPGLNTSDVDSQIILTRYNGPLVVDGKPNLPALQYGQDLVNLYRVLESYNSLSRNQ
ncbi:glycoside hydrolase domain-containing protein [Streptomyces sp. NPDC088387]|uniref:glycoside hydrolase domain-containing protein n=1 Tax=Streptomyces sp. NPDC088387 TaxID=3365859 RepID=UPI0037F60659